VVAGALLTFMSSMSPICASALHVDNVAAQQIVIAAPAVNWAGVRCIRHARDYLGNLPDPANL
jgi:hypothetical protein